MKVILFFIVLFANTAFSQTYTYPTTPKRPVTDDYFGRKITDNYRWMEDMNSIETKTWLKAQATYTDSMLNQLNGRDGLVNTFVAYDALKPVIYGQITRRGNRYFYKKTTNQNNVGKLYYREGKLGPEKLLVDPASFDKKKQYSLSSFKPSEDGSKLVFGLAEGGGEISTVQILNVDTRTLYADTINLIWGGQIGGWSQDGKGFTYMPENSADPADPNRSTNLKAKYHLVGTDPRFDKELFSGSLYPQLGFKPETFPQVTYSPDFKYILGSLISDRLANTFIAPASELFKPTINWKPLFSLKDSIMDYRLLHGRIYMLSIKGAKKGEILVMNAENANIKSAKLLLSEGDLVIENLSVSKDYLFVGLSDGINTTIKQYDLQQNKWSEMKLPSRGTAYVWPNGNKVNDCMLVVTSWNKPMTIYDYNASSKSISKSPFNNTTTYPGVNDIVVEETALAGHDGTKIPLTILRNKYGKKDGKAVCFMTGYGAYGISATPWFNVEYLALLNKGVVIAVSHPRGGGEKGVEWHNGGHKTTKPNTWKDFIASGEWLIKNGYTSAGKLIGEGTSAGGILIGRAITERPDLFAAAINNVGISNTLRFELTANGPSNIWEFGTVKDSVEASALYEMDALHHVKDGVKYPAVISIAGINDPRVTAWQPAKFAAALQSASTSGKPVLFLVNYNNGHFTEDKKVTFLNTANMFAFALWQAGHSEFQPPNKQRKTK